MRNHNKNIDSFYKPIQVIIPKFQSRKQVQKRPQFINNQTSFKMNQKKCDMKCKAYMKPN